MGSCLDTYIGTSTPCAVMAFSPARVLAIPPAFSPRAGPPGSCDMNTWSLRFSRISASSTRASALCFSAASARFWSAAMFTF